jgi:aminoglycoside phosphotransferase (APT) family kinase protein
LRRTLAARYPDWGVTDLEPIGRGVEALVCGARSTRFGPVAFKVPWRRRISNANDPAVDARDLFGQDARLAEHLRRHGVPTPRTFARHVDDDLDFLACELIEHDGGPPNPAGMGRLLRAIHAAPLPDVPLVMQGGRAAAKVVAERLARRLGILERIVGAPLGGPGLPRLREILDWSDSRSALLHMDFRPANLLTRQGRIVAVVDWANALVGDPGLELARAAESGLLDAGFLAGYGVPAPFERLPRPVELVYRLDTAVMLALLFLSEAPNPTRAAAQITRLRELIAATG